MGNIFVAHAPQASLSVYVDDWLQRLTYLNKDVLARDKIQFQNCSAEVIDVGGIYLGQPARLRCVIFFHQNYAYRLLVRAPPKNSTKPGRSVLAPPNWQLPVGAELREFSPDTDVALARDDPDASLSIRVKPRQRGRAGEQLSEHQTVHSQSRFVAIVSATIPNASAGASPKVFGKWSSEAKLKRATID